MAEDRAPLLAIEDLRIAFGEREVVHGVSFAVQAGEIVALVGESGSGKSVTALSALRLLPPPARYPAGRIRWQGEDILAMDERRLQRLRGGEIAMIFQEPMSALNPTMRVGRQIEEVLEIHSALPARERQQRVGALLAAVGIADPESRRRAYPHELSGGQRQRVCIAMALAGEPRLLIADEPTTALDVTIQAQILELLRRLQRERGLAVLFITHDLVLVQELAQRVVVMRHGRVVEQGAVGEVFASPRHPYTRALLACRPRLDERRERLPTVPEELAEQPAD
ncbi:MAG: ABC transporter ATP-binding protein [Planctomycetota bacterium]|nr:ABC transporter ATP-binding protein [Planctomycetota bacterium]MCX8039579.1 ABC transporter ATP-binding protein [Planctomycetota bacterium]MDW8373130.1 ABC transporter ATP-binding protein [Planctomycetota bacterium]